MADQPLEITVGAALSRQFGAAMDMLDNALVACPAGLWHARLWSTPDDGTLPTWLPPEFSEFWYLAYHTLSWLDLYLSASREEEFAPPAPFIWTEGDPAVSPERPYTKEELRAYLAALRRTCHMTLSTLTAERAGEAISWYGWTRGRAVSYLELQVLNLRHIQEHTAQLSLFLGQNGTPDADLRWISLGESAPQRD